MSTPENTDAPAVLLVDDDAMILRGFRRCLEDEGYRVTCAQTMVEVEAALGRNLFDACVLDLNLGETSGLDALPKLREWAPWMRVVMATAVDEVSVAIAALRAGAADYLVKPCSPEDLTHAVGAQVKARNMEKRLSALESEVQSADADFITASPILTATFETARQVAQTDATVLILGESGSGKSVLARAIHNWSKRSANVFATVSCPSLNAELLASELFGHVRGAFTGATDNRQGRVQVADGGTLFLDEVGDLPMSLQPRLLRFIQDREFERVGDPHTRTANVRVVAATNRDLAAMMKAGDFREDLFYRLNVITLTMPPLRERREDILLLAERLLERHVKQYGRPARGFDKRAATTLMQYAWPGNLRELSNVIERASILCNGEAVMPEHLPFTHTPLNVGPGLRAGDPVTLSELERAHIQAVLATASTLESAAKALGIDTSTLYRKRRQYGEMGGQKEPAETADAK